MTPRSFRILGLTLALALHVAVFVPYWLTADTLRGGAGGPVSPSRSMSVQLAQVPPQPQEQPEPEPKPEQEPEQEPEPEAIKTKKEKVEKEQEEKEKKPEQVVQQEPEQEKKKEARETPEPRPTSKAAGDGRKAGPGAHRSGEDDDAWNRYLGEIQRAVERRKTYPRRARLRRQEGVVRVRFRLDARGRIEQVRVSQSSGSRLLDRHVTRLLRDLSLPEPPEGLDVAGRTITLPVQFRLN
jgi:protein TonB